MTPQSKVVLTISFTYELNNIVAFSNTNEAPKLFHHIKKFNSVCNLSFVMLEAPRIYYEIVEEVWTSARYSEIDNSIKNESYIVNAEILNECLHIPINNCGKGPSDLDIRITNYFNPNANLGNIVWKNCRK